MGGGRHQKGYKVPKRTRKSTDSPLLFCVENERELKRKTEANENIGTRTMTRVWGVGVAYAQSPGFEPKYHKKG
jgi:hypothetical protein